MLRFLQVILEKMNDFQLALVVCRLYEVDAPLSDSVRRLLYVHILGRDRQGDNYDASAAHRDPFLRSMAFWLLKEYQCALDTLLEVRRRFQNSFIVNLLVINVTIILADTFTDTIIDECCYLI